MRKKSIIKFSLLIILYLFIFYGTGISKTWQYYYKKGVVEYHAEIYDYAVDNLLRALEINPGLYKAANVIAEIYEMQKNREEAIDYYNISLKINNKQPDIHCRIGELLEFFLKDDLSFSHYKGAVKIDPSHLKGHYNLVRLFNKKGDMAGAFKHFNICYDLGKLEGEKNFELASSEEYENDDKAIELYSAAIEKNPVYIKAYFRLSEIYRRRNDYKNAILYLEKITELKPDNEKAYVYLGHLYYTYGLSWIPTKTRDTMKRRYILSRARANLEEAVRLNPGNPEACYLLSDVYIYLGEDDKAMDVQERAMRSTR